MKQVIADVLSHRMVISPLSTIRTEARAVALDIADSRVAGQSNTRLYGFPNGSLPYPNADKATVMCRLAVPGQITVFLAILVFSVGEKYPCPKTGGPTSGSTSSRFAGATGKPEAKSAGR